MPQTKSDLYMNVSSFIVTPKPGLVSGTAIPVTNITDFELDEDVQTKLFYGDNRLRPRAARNTEERTMLRIFGGDIHTLRTIPKNTPCDIAMVVQDAMTTNTTGDLTYSLGTFMRGKYNAGGKNNEYAMASIEFTAYDPTAADVEPVTVAQGASA